MRSAPALLLLAACASAKIESPRGPTARGGVAECTAGRLDHLEGTVFIEPRRGKLRGQFRFELRCAPESTALSFELDPRFDVEEVRVDGIPRRFSRARATVHLLDLERLSGSASVEVFYVAILRSREMDDLLVSEDFVFLTSTVAWYPAPARGSAFSSSLRIFAPGAYRFVSRGARGSELGTTQTGGGPAMKEVVFEDPRRLEGLSLFGGPHLRSKTATVSKGALELHYTTLSVRDGERVVRAVRETAERVAPGFDSTLLIVFVPGFGRSRSDAGVLVVPEDSGDSADFIEDLSQRVAEILAGV